MAARTTIENPVINSPFEEPKRHFVFTDEGISDTIAAGRRKSVYFNPIAWPKTRGKNLEFDFAVKSRPEGNRLPTVYHTSAKPMASATGRHRPAKPTGHCRGGVARRVYLPSACRGSSSPAAAGSRHDQRPANPPPA